MDASEFLIDEQAEYPIRVFWSTEDEMYVAICPRLGDISALSASCAGAVSELRGLIPVVVDIYQKQGWPLTCS